MLKVYFIESLYVLDKIKGIGLKCLVLLEELNIKLVEDLVLYLLICYEDNIVIDLN